MIEEYNDRIGISQDFSVLLDSLAESMITAKLDLSSLSDVELVLAKGFAQLASISTTIILHNFLAESFRSPIITTSFLDYALLAVEDIILKAIGSFKYLRSMESSLNNVLTY